MENSLRQCDAGIKSIPALFETARRSLHATHTKPAISKKIKRQGDLPQRCGTSMGTRTPVFAVRGRRLNRLTMEAEMAAELGFEPRMNESESLVLPLHHSARSSVQVPCTRPTNGIIPNFRSLVKGFFPIWNIFRVFYRNATVVARTN